MDVANALRAETEEQTRLAGTRPSLGAQVHALRCARDELISWIEGELAKISEGESEASLADVLSSPRKAPEPASNGGQALTVDEIHRLYDRYVASRQALVATIDAVRQDAPGSSSPTKETAPPLSASARGGSSAISGRTTDILPFIPTLVQVSKEEKSMMQQTKYLRRQLAGRSDETLRNIRRLADESHLVPPGSSSMASWAVTAHESSNSTEEFVLERIQEGEAQIAQAKETLSEIQAQRGALGQLEGSL
ncbi:hypothetical protein BDY21DRAFT_336321 [Lineolata rhizophorae]|uniref:Uncharacterized protein n=1 Tax=Lineolata rhizophorae TaxID=578093 RepID=A0A6A6P6V8_9PEZI|nr:hypothetical protein BDY21DRAFT_336321 [Lineolata rhizophorae]